MKIVLRKARPEDRDKAIWVESKSTPDLRYVPHVLDRFLGDATGDWSVAELDGEIVGCRGWVNIQYPPSAADIHEAVAGYGFRVGASDFIVMEAHLKS
jgi:hypothetical protein